MNDINTTTKLTNGEKFKTAKERHEAYDIYCESMRSSNLAIMHDKFEWLELEYDVALRVCPFCEGEAKLHKTNSIYTVHCSNCGAKTVDTITATQAIAAWNRRAK